MRDVKRICVFCGSSDGARQEFTEQAAELGRTIASRGIGLVYGGGGIGLMGAIANAVIQGDGEVIGVIPYALATKERALQSSISRRVELRVVRTMHERKATMAELADAFIAMPGGLGTFEELFEILTWAQIGIHTKPIGLLNTAGYFDPLISLIDRAIDEGFIREKYRGLIVESPDVDRLLEKIFGYESLESIVKWIEMDET